MMIHMFDWLQSEGAASIALNVAFANEAAQRFYAHFGFDAVSLQMRRVLPGKGAT